MVTSIDSTPVDIEKIILSLNSDSVENRIVAAEQLGIIGDTRAIEPLIKTLSSQDTTYLRKATEALAKLGRVINCNDVTTL